MRQRNGFLLVRLGKIQPLPFDTNNREQETDTSQTSRAPQSCLVLLCQGMALVDVDGLGHGRGDGEGDATADLERCVDLFFVGTCLVRY
jgi:hypothetical protein